jgi:toxin ParE1/3/4
VRKREVFFSPEAQADLNGLYDHITDQSGAARANGYMRRIERYCRGFEFASARGTRRDDIRPGLRVVGFERRITIAFHVEPDRVIVDRLFYGGRDLARGLASRPK